MKPKNVMLLGFVNKAVKYLERHLDDGSSSKLTELRNIDLEKIKTELSHSLDQSLGIAQSTINTLLQIGEDIFDDFISIHNESGTLSSELDRMFDISLDEDETSNTNDLEHFLSFYNLDSEFNLDDIDLKDDTNYVEIYNNNNHVDNTENTKYVEVFNIESFIKKLTEEENILKEVLNKSKEIEDDKDVKAEALLDDEVLNQEEDEPVFELSQEDSELLELIANNLSKVEKPSEQIQEDNLEQDIQELDDIFLEVISDEHEKTEEIEDYNLVPEQVDQNDILKLLQEIQIADDTYYGSIEDFTLEDTSNDVNFDEEIEDESNEDDVYESSLIDDLRKKMIEEDEIKRVQEEEFMQVYERIHKQYPYISNSFIRSVYDLKQNITNEYPLDSRIIILHRCIFVDVESLRQFVEIGLSHDYSINADEDKLIVDIFKEYVNSDGKILTSIFEVANQSALLNGKYDGYRVMLVEKV